MNLFNLLQFEQFDKESLKKHHFFRLFKTAQQKSKKNSIFLDFFLDLVVKSPAFFKTFLKNSIFLDNKSFLLLQFEQFDKESLKKHHFF